MKFFLISIFVISSSQTIAKNLSSQEFVDCYKKAMNERILEIKASSPKKEMCSEMSEAEELLLQNIYVDDFIMNGKVMRFSAADIGNTKLQTHYDYINKKRVQNKIKCIASEFHLLNKTDLDLVRETLEKMAGKKFSFRDWHQSINKHSFQYCL